LYDMHAMQASHYASEAGRLEVAKLLLFADGQGGPFNHRWGNSSEPGIQERQDGDDAFAATAE
jgi:hypothetical protein